MKNTINVIITVGVSASGKSTFAKQKVQENPKEVKEINRDILRAKLQLQRGVEGCTPEKPNWDKWKFKDEKEITKNFYDEFQILCSFPETKTIIWSDTNLNFDRLQSSIAVLKEKASLLNTELIINYEFFIEENGLVNEELLIKRDNKRPNGVGASIIHKQVKELHDNLPKFWELPEFPENLKENYNNLVHYFKRTEFEKTKEYKNSLKTDPNKTKERIIIVDLDGTIAEMNNRTPYEYEKVFQDSIILINENIIEAFAKAKNTNKIIFMTGREDIGNSRKETLKFINQKSSLPFVAPYELYMRKAEDHRKDYIIKQELFLEHIGNQYEVLAVFDDRPQVCRMWWHLGLKVFQMQNAYLDF